MEEGIEYVNIKGRVVYNDFTLPTLMLLTGWNERWRKHSRIEM